MGHNSKTCKLSHRRSCPRDNQVAPSRRPKGGTTRYRRNLDTVCLEVLWSRASKTVSHKGAYLELDALTNRKPGKGVSDEERDMGELWDSCSLSAS